MTLKFSNSMSMAAAFLHIVKSFETTWHPGKGKIAPLL